MKKIKLDSAKLKLNKEKIASLTDDETGMVNGGGIPVLENNTDLFKSRAVCNSGQNACNGSFSCKAFICIPLTAGGSCQGACGE